VVIDSNAIHLAHDSKPTVFCGSEKRLQIHYLNVRVGRAGMSHSPAPWPSQDPSLLRPNREGLAGEHLEALAEVAGAVVGQPHLELLPLASGPEGGGGLFERKVVPLKPIRGRIALRNPFGLFTFRARFRPRHSPLKFPLAIPDDHSFHQSN